jgi:NDP-sugar pyrophosphorylase family protein
MEAAELNIKIINVNKKLDILQRIYIDKTIEDIKLLPPENQKNYWYKIGLLNDYLDASYDFTQELINELAKRKSPKEVEHLKNHIKVLRQYIEILGGNPSNCNFA